MAILHDYHLHTDFSGDCNTPMEDMIQRAISYGLHGICITEHLDYDYPVCEACPPGFFDLNIPAYKDYYLKIQAKYADKLELLFGIELGVQPHLADIHRRILAEYHFDFVLASAHTCHGKDPYFPEFYMEREEEEAYREYFTCVLENLDTYQDFDAFAHMDYVVRYGPNKDTFYSYQRYCDLLDAILLKLISMGKALECNTGAINYGLRSLNPSKEILLRYRQLGGELVTIGSDAHRAPALAHGFDVARELLMDCGFTHYATFKNRTPRLHRL